MERCFEVISIGDTLVAKKNVPDMVEPACGFFKDKNYKVANIRKPFVDIYDDYGSIDSFSTNSSNENYIWEWFQKV